MARKPVVCKHCGSKWHYSSMCPNIQKPIPRQSAKEISYQVWKETVARPFLTKRDGNSCHCCGRPAWEGEKLDIEHELGKGSHPELKKDLDNLRLFCRIPCHRNKTDGKPCLHLT